MAGLSVSARRRALQLRLKDIQHKIGRVQQEIATVQGSSRAFKPSLFDKEPAGLRSLRDRLTQLKGIERELQNDLRTLR